MQRGGSPTFAYTGDVIMTKTGAPQAVWTAADPYAAGDVRVAPQVGGGCGCMGLQRGGGGGAGGYSTVLNNVNTGYPEAYVKGACLPAQVGGSGSPVVAWSDRAGYGYVQPYNSANANFMEYVPTGRAMQLGGRSRKNKSKSKSKRRSRR